MLKDDVLELLLSPPPCAGCQHAERCKADKLACVAFDFYAKGLSPIRWQAAPRQPTREQFNQLFA